MPENYADEAGFCAGILKDVLHPPLSSVLGLGKGGGNNAFRLKKYFTMTLLDVSEGMLKVSQQINQECTHVAALA